MGPFVLRNFHVKSRMFCDFGERRVWRDLAPERREYGYVCLTQEYTQIAEEFYNTGEHVSDGVHGVGCKARCALVVGTIDGQSSRCRNALPQTLNPKLPEFRKGFWNMGM